MLTVRQVRVLERAWADWKREFACRFGIGWVSQASGLVPTLLPNDIVIMDNLPVHKVPASSGIRHSWSVPRNRRSYDGHWKSWKRK